MDRLTPTRRAAVRERRGYFAIGIEGCKTEQNIGSLWRAADLMGASFAFTVGARYRRQASDTMKSWRGIPLFPFECVDDLRLHLPQDAVLVGVELLDAARDLLEFTHPERACYLLGAEDRGLSEHALQRCHAVVRLPGRYSMNVACAGSIVMYARMAARAVA